MHQVLALWVFKFYWGIKCDQMCKQQQPLSLISIGCSSPLSKQCDYLNLRQQKNHGRKNTKLINHYNYLIKSNFLNCYLIQNRYKQNFLLNFLQQLFLKEIHSMWRLSRTKSSNKLTKHILICLFITLVTIDCATLELTDNYGGASRAAGQGVQEEDDYGQVLPQLKIPEVKSKKQKTTKIKKTKVNEKTQEPIDGQYNVVKQQTSKTTKDQTVNIVNEKKSSTNNIGNRGKFQLIKDCSKDIRTRKNQYIIINNYQKDSSITIVIKFIQQIFVRIFSRLRIITVYRQTIATGTNFKFIFSVKYSPSSNQQVQYVAVFFQSTGSSNLQLVQSDFVELPAFDSKRLRRLDNTKEAQVLNEVETALRASLKDKLNGFNTLMQPEVIEPYYLLTYAKSSGDKIKVILLYDIFKDTVKIIDVTEIKMTTQLSTKKPKQNPIQKVIQPNNQIVKPIPKPNTDSKLQIIRQIQSQSKIESKRSKTKSKPKNLTPQIKQQKQLAQPIIPTENNIPSIVVKQSSSKKSTRIQQTKPKIKPIKQIEKPIEKPTQKPIEKPIQNPLIDNPIEKPIRPVKPIQPIQKPIKPIKTQKKPLQPTYTFSLDNNQYTSQLSTISDPALIPFMTTSYIQDLNPNKIDPIIKFVIKKAVITEPFTIILINQIPYAARFVFSMSGDRLYEVVVTYLYKNGNKDNADIQLLVWRQLDSILDIDPDVFTKYYTLQNDSVHPIYYQLIERAFKSEQNIRKFKKLIKNQIKASFDAVYYKLLLETTTDKRYQIILSWIPQIDTVQILKYELLSNGYNAQKQSRLQALPTNDKYFQTVKKFIVDKYSQILKDSSITFMATFSIKQIRYYRIGFSGSMGKYQVIVTIDPATLISNVIRWEKLEDGYVQYQTKDFQNQDYFKKILVFVRNYVNQKFKFDTSPAAFEVRNIPDYSKYYRFFFNNPLPFALTVNQRNQNEDLLVRGIERIQIVPSNQFYNDRLFSGYSLVNIPSLKYDPYYRQFIQILFKSQISLRIQEYDIVAAFKLSTPMGLTYKIIYKAMQTGRMFIATFYFDYVTNQYSLASFEPYQRKVQEGDYRWKCKRVNQKSRGCEGCQSDQYVLTAGRCYLRILGCNLQIASTCAACSSGYVRNSRACQRSPQKAISLPQSNTNPNIIQIKQRITTSTGPRTVVYQTSSQSGVICLNYDGPVCVLCAYRYYLHNGGCAKVDDSCSTYDQKTGQCISCYERYYKYQNNCVPLDPLCAKGDQTGRCIKCFDQYLNVKGVCQQRGGSITSVKKTPGSITTTFIEQSDPYIQIQAPNVQHYIVQQNNFNVKGSGSSQLQRKGTSLVAINKNTNSEYQNVDFSQDGGLVVTSTNSPITYQTKQQQRVNTIVMPPTTKQYRVTVPSARQSEEGEIFSKLVVVPTKNMRKISYQSEDQYLDRDVSVGAADDQKNGVQGQQGSEGSDGTDNESQLIQDVDYIDTNDGQSQPGQSTDSQSELN